MATAYPGLRESCNRREERAISVLAAVVALLLVVFFVLAELIIGHD